MGVNIEFRHFTYDILNQTPWMWIAIYGANMT